MNVRWLICLFGMLPYLWKLTYLHVVWRSSPLDTTDIVFLPLALVSIGLGVWRDRRFGRGVDSGVDFMALFVLIPSAAAFAVSVIYRVNAFQVLSAVVFGWACWWFARTWISARRASRGFAIMALTTTSVTYWVSNLTGMDEWVVRALKLVSACLLLAIPWRHLWRYYVWPILAIAVLVLLFNAKLRKLMVEGDDFQPSFEICNDFGLVAREIEPDPGFRRFFGTSKARQLVFASPSNTIHVLAVEIGSDSREIHPATHCLKTSGWEVISEGLRLIDVGDRRVSISEAIVEKFGTQELSWSWYSDTKRSTGNYLSYRTHYHRANWRAYQLRIVVSGGIAAAREALQVFLSRQAVTGSTPRTGGDGRNEANGEPEGTLK